MELIIEATGQGRCVYSELFELAMLGPLSIRRASHVEPDDQGRWIADLSPVDGPQLGPFAQRSAALEAEIEWLQRQWLGSARLDSARLDSDWLGGVTS
jgi:hypothetical protein